YSLAPSAQLPPAIEFNQQRVVPGRHAAPIEPPSRPRTAPPPAMMTEPEERPSQLPPVDDSPPSIRAAGTESPVPRSTPSSIPAPRSAPAYDSAPEDDEFDEMFAAISLRPAVPAPSGEAPSNEPAPTPPSVQGAPLPPVVESSATESSVAPLSTIVDGLDVL